MEDDQPVLYGLQAAASVLVRAEVDEAIASKEIENIDNRNIKAKKILVKPVLLDANLHKQFKNHHFSKIDLHGLTVDQAHQKLIEYFSINYKKKNLFHIVVTGLGNKTNGEEFFTGKIRRQFPFWLDTEIILPIILLFQL